MNNKEVLADRIVVYRNAIPNREEIIKNIKKDQYWEKWYDVGKQIIVTNSNEFAFNDFPDKKTWDQKNNLWKSQGLFFDQHPEAYDKFKWAELEEAFYNTTKDYLDMFPIKNMPNWERGGTNFLRYDAKGEDEVTTEASGTISYALPFHTDFDYPTADKPGLKPAITVTMYLNDDYEGGDIEYRIFNKSHEKILIEGTTMIDKDTDEIVPGFNYQPQAGDIIIFPSSLPYYHGVKKVTKGQKLFIRTFWMYRKY